MVSLVRRINKCGPAVGPWIFQLLKKHRAMADKHPECCQEFYTLLQEFCRGFENCTRLVEVSFLLMVACPVSLLVLHSLLETILPTTLKRGDTACLYFRELFSFSTV